MCVLNSSPEVMLYMTQNYFAIRGFCVLLVPGMAKAVRSNAPDKRGRIVVCANDMQLDCGCLHFVIVLIRLGWFAFGP